MKMEQLILVYGNMICSMVKDVKNGQMEGMVKRVIVVILKGFISMGRRRDWVNFYGLMELNMKGSLKVIILMDMENTLGQIVNIIKDIGKIIKSK